jgi:hypothetical protein
MSEITVPEVPVARKVADIITLRPPYRLIVHADSDAIEATVAVVRYKDGRVGLIHSSPFDVAWLALAGNMITSRALEYQRNSGPKPPSPPVSQA